MTTSFEKILFCTDFSAVSARAFDYAVKAAVRNRAKLYILHVAQDAAVQFWKGYVVEDGSDLAEKNAAAVKGRMQSEYGIEIPASVEWEPCYEVGQPAERILGFVREKGVSLVVMGRPRPQPLRSLLFGSVAARVSRTVACPLLIIPD
ncbi:MAG: universal stress protein [Kiritimatiellae bacterium]|nr:universal stress protein [Kiritimatiellia bacterium]